MELLSNTDLSTICRMCTSNLLDQECYVIDEELEDLIVLLVSLKFDHIENKENLRMCVNCYDCLKSFNDFRANCINIHEKLIILDLTEKVTEEEFFIEEVSEQPDMLGFKTEEDYEDVEGLAENYDGKMDEIVYAVEKIIDSDDQEEEVTQKYTPPRKANSRREATSTDRGKEIYKRLLQKCTICGKMVEKNRLEGHINKHNNIRPYSCPECQKEFYCKQLLRLHRTSIHTNIKLKCEVCEKFFPSARALYAHTLRHKNENRYICNLCDKKFNNANSLKRHEAIHSGIREFICNTCGVGFYRKFNLDVHVKNVHDQAKEFICSFDDCKKSFGYARLLKDHMRKSHKSVIYDNSEF